MTSTGRFTLPSEENFAEKTKELAELWGADAIRNSDGTHLDEAVLALGKKITMRISRLARITSGLRCIWMRRHRCIC